MLLQADRPLYDSDGGVPERIAVYTILAFEVMLGLILLAPAAPGLRAPGSHRHGKARVMTTVPSSALRLAVALGVNVYLLVTLSRTVRGPAAMPTSM